VPDAERCRKASREGTSRVFEARGGDKPGLPYLAGILGFSRHQCIGHQDAVTDTCQNHVTKNMHVGIRVHLGTGIRDYASCRNSGIHLFHPFSAISSGNHHSRSLEGKYTFLGGICWILGQGRSEAMIYIEFRCSRWIPEFRHAHLTASY